MANDERRTNELVELLAKFGPKTVQGMWFNNRHVALDGYVFQSCRFDNCTLHISSGNFQFDRCHIDMSTTITYGATTLKVVKLFNSRNDWFYEHYPSLAPTRNHDGTISIM